MADNWEDFETWWLVLPPNRPTDTFLSVLRRCISTRTLSGNTLNRVAVLGSTPELRDELWESGAKEIYVFERSRQFYDKMKVFRVRSGCERLVEGDWLDTLSKYKDQFDVVVSDLTSGNISYDDRNRFYSSICHSLTDSGCFVDRILMNTFDLLKLDALDQRYNLRPFNLKTLNDFSSEYLFLSELTKDGVVDSSEFYDLLIGRFRHKQRLLRFVLNATYITPRNAKWYYGRPWTDLSASYLKHFGHTEEFSDEPGTVYSGKTRIFISGREPEIKMRRLAGK